MTRLAERDVFRHHRRLGTNPAAGFQGRRAVSFGGMTMARCGSHLHRTAIRQRRGCAPPAEADVVLATRIGRVEEIYKRTESRHSLSRLVIAGADLARVLLSRGGGLVGRQPQG